MNNQYDDKKGALDIKPVTLETVDQALYDYFDKKIVPTVDTERGRKKVSVIFATGERWALIRDNKGLRDENGTLILPLISIRRTDIEKTSGMSSMPQEFSHITIAKNLHEKTGNIQNLIKTRKLNGFPQAKRPPVFEYTSIPMPKFATLFYEITIWTQFQAQMNEVLEKIFYSDDYLESFTIPVEYDTETKKGKGHYFTGFKNSNVTPESNVVEFSDQERIIKYTYSIKIPAYFLLDPDTEALAYGRNKGTSPNDTNSKVLFKTQNIIDVSLREQIGDSDSLSVKSDLKPVRIRRVGGSSGGSSSGGGGGSGGGSTPTFDFTIPQPISVSRIYWYFFKIN